MNSAPQPEPVPEKSASKIKTKIFGVGNTGVRVLELLSRAALPGATLVAVDLEPESLSGSASVEKIALELKQQRGLGTGGDPERGRALAEHRLPELKAACDGADVVFIVTGLGGGAGTGVSPLIARAACETGALVLAFVSLPFDCEGNRRGQQAQRGLQELRAVADGVICLPNQKLFRLIDENTGVRETFQRANEQLAEGVIHVWRLFACKGFIEIHFADLAAVLRERDGESVLASAEAAGRERGREVMDKLLAHPMLDGGQALADAATVLVSLTGGPELSMAEINLVMERINDKCSGAQVVMGAAIDEQFGARLAVTVVAGRRGEPPPAPAGQDEAARPASRTGGRGDDLNNRLVNRVDTPRPQSRFVPPPPTLPQEKIDQLLPEAAGATRRRKGSPRMRQGQLPLEIVSKGRFDKSEPTIHKGEDLDVPTYIRRGVSLN